MGGGQGTLRGVWTDATGRLIQGLIQGQLEIEDLINRECDVCELELNLNQTQFLVKRLNYIFFEYAS